MQVRDDNIRVEGLRSFMALLGDEDVGLFVTTSGFSKDAQEEARTEQRLLSQAQAKAIRLRGEKRLLESDWSTIEDAARRELGLIKPGEKIFTIKDVPAASNR